MCKKLRSSFGHRFYPVIFPSITNSTRTAAKLCPNFLWQHRTIASASLSRLFAPLPQFRKWEIHTVFLHFRNFELEQKSCLRLLAELCGAALCFFSQQSGFGHQDIIKHFRRSSLRFFHERDLLIIVVVWSANHFCYNGEFFPCLLYSSLEAILLPPA